VPHSPELDRLKADSLLLRRIDRDSLRHAHPSSPA